MKDMTSGLKDRAVFAGWIAVLVLIAALLWSLSFPFRSNCLMRAANKVLISMDDDRHIAAPVLRPPAGPAPLGCWYRLYESGSLFFVFAIMREGILVPCGAEISEQGQVVEIIPLGSHARQVMNQIPQGLIQVYVRRIESAAAAIIAAKPGRREG
jgi:hypothetical protein